MATPQKSISLSLLDGSSERVRPPLKWAGGKRWQVYYIAPYWKSKRYRRLVEPFCGGLAIALGLSPELALLNDINPHLINFYRHLKNGFISNLEAKNEQEFFYAKRLEFNSLLRRGKGETKQAAELFYYLNRTGFNGLCRFNKSGEFNVPFGRYKTINYKTDFREYVSAFANWQFTSVHFDQIELNPHDFVYADPPYDVDFHHYSKGGFGWDEQERTALWLSKHPGPVILVNQATRRIIELYRDLNYNLQFLLAPRRISCTGDRTPANEVLAIRNLP